METRASFVVIGTFTISVIVGVFLFVLWLAQVEIDREIAEYDVIFETAVTGLSKAGEVQYSGIKVGEVAQLNLDRDNPSNVVARIKIDALTPVSADTTASLEYWGLTGVSYIQLFGGGPQSKPLEAKEGEEVPVIIATPSAFQELYARAPDVLSGASGVMAGLQNLLSQENQTKVTNILTNIEMATASIGDRGEQIGQFIDNAAAASSDLASSTGQIKRISDSLATFADDGTALIQDARDTTASIKTLADNANDVLLASSPSIRSFTEGGLAEFGAFVSESRRLIRTLDRVLQKLESDPASYISGNFAAEYEAD